MRLLGRSLPSPARPCRGQTTADRTGGLQRKIFIRFSRLEFDYVSHREGVAKDVAKMIDVYTGGMALQAPHFAYSVDERAFLSEPAFYKGKSRLKVGLIPQ